MGEGAHGGNWCGAPPLIWVELVPLMLWHDPGAVVEVLLLGRSTSTSGMSPKVGCSEPSAMVEIIWVGGRFWVEVWRRALS
jgi:hypothetical protein